MTEKPGFSLAVKLDTGMSIEEIREKTLEGLTDREANYDARKNDPYLLTPDRVNKLVDKAIS